MTPLFISLLIPGFPPPFSCKNPSKFWATLVTVNNEWSRILKIRCHEIYRSQHSGLYLLSRCPSLWISAAGMRCFYMWPSTGQCYSVCSSSCGMSTLWQRSLGVAMKGHRQVTKHQSWIVASIRFPSSSFVAQSARGKGWEGTCLGRGGGFQVGHVPLQRLGPWPFLLTSNIFISLLTAFPLNAYHVRSAAGLIALRMTRESSRKESNLRVLFIFSHILKALGFIVTVLNERGSWHQVGSSWQRF